MLLFYAEARINADESPELRIFAIAVMLLREFGQWLLYDELTDIRVDN